MNFSISSTEDVAKGLGFSSVLSMMQEVTLERIGIPSQKKYVICKYLDNNKKVLVPKGVSTWDFLSAKFGGVEIKRVQGIKDGITNDIDSPNDLTDGEHIVVYC